MENGTERCTSNDESKPHLTLNSHIISATLRPPNNDFFHVRSVNITMKVSLLFLSSERHKLFFKTGFSTVLRQLMMVRDSVFSGIRPIWSGAPRDARLFHRTKRILTAWWVIQGLFRILQKVVVDVILSLVVQKLVHKSVFHHKLMFTSPRFQNIYVWIITQLVLNPNPRSESWNIRSITWKSGWFPSLTSPDPKLITGKALTRATRLIKVS